MKELQTHNLPKIGGLFFSSTYNKGFKDYVRILTQLFTFSKYDHCATLIQCPMELNGKMLNDPIVDSFTKSAINQLKDPITGEIHLINIV